MNIGLGVSVNVRHAPAPWSPAALPSLAGWWTAGPTWCFTDAGGTVPCGDGDAIRVWVDRSGNARDLSQGTAANRPTLRLTGALWYADFDGNDYVSGAAGTALLRGAHTVLYAARHGADGVAVSHDTTSGGSGDPGYGRASGNLTLFKVAASAQQFALAVADNADFVAAFRSAGDSGGSLTARAWANGTVAAADKTVTVGDTTGLRFGQALGDPFTGRIYELILAAAELSDANRERAETYLIERVGL